MGREKPVNDGRITSLTGDWKPVRPRPPWQSEPIAARALRRTTDPNVYLRFLVRREGVQGQHRLSKMSSTPRAFASVSISSQ